MRTAAPELDPPASFTSALDEFFSAVRRSRARAAREAGAGELTLSQYQLLAALADEAGNPREPELPVGELAEAAGCAAPTATRMLGGLERDGIVERRPSSSDRRVVTVRLTRRGRRLVDEKERVVQAKRRALYASLGDSERAQVERLLRRLAGVIEEL
jgi:DNA-binding MarR family transcriptional regulator